jgi:uncharacterized membrane protein YphA (DoxX/SURF4 family)
MKNVITILQILLGLGLVVFGLNKFLLFMPFPEMTPEMGSWMGALMATGFIMKIVAVLEILTGVMLLINKYVPLSLVVILPIMIVAFLSHLILDIGGVGGSAIFLFLIIFLMFQNKEAYKDLLKA